MCVVKELIKSKEELEEIADLLEKEIRNHKENVVSRYLRDVIDQVTYNEGKTEFRTKSYCNINKEAMDSRVYTSASIDDLSPDNFTATFASRDSLKTYFNFFPKGIELPKDQLCYFESIPSGIDLYDQDLKEFTKAHRNTTITRTFAIEQKVIVNSKGGKAIQTIPFFEIFYSQGYSPLCISRKIAAVCTSEKDIRALTSLIKYMPDPTPEKRIRKAKSFWEAFCELYRLSGLCYASLAAAGIEKGVNDVVILTGVPVHEIFGHHFEEELTAAVDEVPVFEYGQAVGNNKIILKDDPAQEIEGFKTWGFTYIDAYGRKRKARTHIKDGKCLEFLGSEYTKAKEDKSPFVGNASQSINGLFPQPRMSCTVLDGTVEEIDLEGKILCVPHSGKTNTDKTYSYTLFSGECYIVKNGEPMRIIPLTISGGICNAIKNLALLKDWSYVSGFCEKSDPITSNVSSILVSEFCRNQVWREQQVFSYCKFAGFEELLKHKPKCGCK